MATLDTSMSAPTTHTPCTTSGKPVDSRFEHEWVSGNVIGFSDGTKYLYCEAKPSYNPDAGEEWVPPGALALGCGEVIHAYYKEDWDKQVRYFREQTDIVIEQALKVFKKYDKEIQNSGMHMTHQYYNMDGKSSYAELTADDFIYTPRKDETPVQEAYSDFQDAVTSVQDALYSVPRSNHKISYMDTWAYKNIGYSFY
jgi:hypothetical protein